MIKLFLRKLAILMKDAGYDDAAGYLLSNYIMNMFPATTELHRHLDDMRIEKENLHIHNKFLSDRVDQLILSNNEYMQRCRDANNRVLILESQQSWKPTHQHIKRGSSYQCIGSGILQTDKPLEDNARLVVYKDERGEFYFRTPEEFDDGRFERIYK